MVNLTTRCSCGDYMNPRHTYRRAISRIATTGSARTKMPAARNRGRSDFAVRFRVVRLSFFTTSGSVVYWSSHTTSKEFSMVITSLCPVCLATSSVQTLVEGQREFLKIYHCPNHGSF